MNACRPIYPRQLLAQRASEIAHRNCIRARPNADPVQQQISENIVRHNLEYYQSEIDRINLLVA